MRKMSFSEFLKSTRKKKKQTQVEAGAEVGVRSQTWHAWERGQLPRAGRLNSIAAWAGVKVKRLCDLAEKNEKEAS